jgi:hypothetical protein
LSLDDPGLDIIHRDAAGIDVGNESHFVSVPPDRDSQPIREFGSWTTALEEMARWLKQCRIRTVVMQSTGVYWIALHDVLQRHGLDVNLVDARAARTCPDEKVTCRSVNGCGSCTPMDYCVLVFCLHQKSTQCARFGGCTTSTSAMPDGASSKCKRR